MYAANLTETAGDMMTFKLCVDTWERRVDSQFYANLKYISRKQGDHQTRGGDTYSRHRRLQSFDPLHRCAHLPALLFDELHRPLPRPFGPGRRYDPGKQKPTTWPKSSVHTLILAIFEGINGKDGLMIQIDPHFSFAYADITIVRCLPNKTLLAAPR